MTSAIDAILSSLPPDRELWMRCESLSKHPPLDQPRVRKLAQTHRTARLYTTGNDDTRWIGEWFSIPTENIQRVLHESPDDEQEIRVDALAREDIETLFDQTTVIFHIGYCTTEEEWVWCETTEEEYGGDEQGDGEA